MVQPIFEEGLPESSPAEQRDLGMRDHPDQFGNTRPFRLPRRNARSRFADGSSRRGTRSNRSSSVRRDISLRKAAEPWRFPFNAGCLANVVARSPSGRHDIELVIAGDRNPNAFAALQPVSDVSSRAHHATLSHHMGLHASRLGSANVLSSTDSGHLSPVRRASLWPANLWTWAMVESGRRVHFRLGRLADAKRGCSCVAGSRIICTCVGAQATGDRDPVLGHHVRRRSVCHYSPRSGGGNRHGKRSLRSFR